MTFAPHASPLEHPGPDISLFEPPALPRYTRHRLRPLTIMPPLAHAIPRPEVAHVHLSPVLEMAARALDLEEPFRAPAQPVGAVQALAPARYRYDQEPAAAKEMPTRRRVDPIFGYLLFWALGVGTLSLDVEIRHLVMWLLLLVVGLAMTLVDTNRPVGPIRVLNLTWGIGLGFIVGLPLIITTARGLAQVSAALFPYSDLSALFQALVFVGPMGETLFYRGAMQNERGLITAALTAGLGSLILYLPAFSEGIMLLVIAVTISTALAAVFGYVRTRYGLGAAYAAQVITNVMLLFIPRLLMG
jgi:hypothetical protein